MQATHYRTMQSHQSDSSDNIKIHISDDSKFYFSSKFYFQQNTTMEQYQEKENTL